MLPLHNYYGMSGPKSEIIKLQRVKINKKHNATRLTSNMCQVPKSRIKRHNDFLLK